MIETINILLVDDDEVDIQSMQRAIKKAALPAQLHIARNGIEALENLTNIQAKAPLTDLIILDINMPKMNGLEFLSELRANPAYEQTKVIILTTSKFDQTRIHQLNLEVDKYLLKPIKSQELLQICQHLFPSMAEKL